MENSKKNVVYKEAYMAYKELMEVDEESTECQIVDSSNVQSCWESMIDTCLYMDMDAEKINSHLAMVDLTIISYTPHFQVWSVIFESILNKILQVMAAKFFQMLSVGAFMMMAPSLSLVRRQRKD